MINTTSDIWFQSLQGGSCVAVTSKTALTLRSATLGQTVKGPLSRTSLQLRCKGNEAWSTILCTLIPGKVERATLKIRLQKETEYELEILGDNDISVLGDAVGIVELHNRLRPQASEMLATEVIAEPNTAYLALPFLWIEDGEPGKGHAVNWGHLVSVWFFAKVGGPKGRIYQQTDGKPLKFIVGSPDIIKGLSQGVMGMRRGGTRRIHIPPSLGFGQRGSQKYKIPGGSNLVIECRLVTSTASNPIIFS